MVGTVANWKISASPKGAAAPQLQPLLLSENSEEVSSDFFRNAGFPNL